jgi:hypothetical protein
MPKEKEHERYLRRRQYYKDYGKRRYLERVGKYVKPRTHELILGGTLRELIDKSIATGSSAYYRKMKELYRRKLIELYGGECKRCGFLDWRALQIDHINDDGSAERKSLTSASNFYLRIMKNINRDKYQVLCANCNWIKKYERGALQ